MVSFNPKNRFGNLYRYIQEIIGLNKNPFNETTSIKTIKSTSLHSNPFIDSYRLEYGEPNTQDPFYIGFCQGYTKDRPETFFEKLKRFLTYSKKDKEKFEQGKIKGSQMDSKHQQILWKIYGQYKNQQENPHTNEKLHNEITKIIEKDKKFDLQSLDSMLD